MNVSGSASSSESGGFIEIRQLDKNHPGVTYALSEALCEAAAVCLDRHHAPPQQFQVKCDGKPGTSSLQWDRSSPRARNSHANEDDATRDGAYAVCLLCAERYLNLIAIGRAETKTGSDWYVAPVSLDIDPDGLPNLDLPGVHRLEVSGQDLGSIGARVTQKKHQLSVGKSSIPGIAAVVGFERATVALEYSDAKEGAD